jgi:hypothetical protein
MIRFVRDLSLLKLENLEGFHYHQLKVDRNDFVNRRFITRLHGLIQRVRVDVLTDGQSAYQSWCRAPLWDP